LKGKRDNRKEEKEGCRSGYSGKSGGKLVAEKVSNKKRGVAEKLLCPYESEGEPTHNRIR